MNNGFRLGLAIASSGRAVQRKGSSKIAVRFDSNDVNPFLPLFASGYQFPRRSCYSMIAVKVIVDTLMILCHELPVAVARPLTCLRTKEGLSAMTQLTALIHSFILHKSLEAI